jgi:hypothetical protein
MCGGGGRLAAQAFFAGSTDRETSQVLPVILKKVQHALF